MLDFPGHIQPILALCCILAIIWTMTFVAHLIPSVENKRDYDLDRTSQWCLQWVKSRHSEGTSACLLYPQRTSHIYEYTP